MPAPRRLLGFVDSSWPSDKVPLVRNLFEGALRFCRGQRLNTFKTRIVLAVLAETWEADARAWHRDPGNSFAHLQALLLAHAVERPPASAADLSPPEAKALVDWVLPFYYARFRLYKHCLGSRPSLVLRQEPRGGVERPAPARPLADGIMVASQRA